MTQRKPVYIELLGSLRVRIEGQPPVTLPRQQTGALLAYLALRHNQSHSREDLMALIWPEDAPDTARHKLRQALYSLRRQLGLSASETETVLLTTRASIQLCSDSVTTDVIRFEAATQNALRTHEFSECMPFLQEAVRLYRGELLPGFYQEIFVVERHRLEDLYRFSLQRLTQAYEYAGDLNQAIITARRLLALDSLREEVHAELMRLYAATGQPSAVLRQYQDLASALKEELGVEPSDATQRLLETLRQTAEQNSIALRTGGASASSLASGDTQPLSAHIASPLPGEENVASISVSVRPQDEHLSTMALVTSSIAGNTDETGYGSSETLSQPDNNAMVVEAASASPVVLDPPAVRPRLVGLQAIGVSVLLLLFIGLMLVWRMPRSQKPSAPPSHVLWMARYTPQKGDKTSEATAVATHDGWFYVTGFVDTVAHDADFLTVLYDVHGNLLWQARYNGPGNDVDRARAIAVDDTGNVYVTGESDNGKGNGKTRLSGTDFATLKYGPDGKPSPTWPNVGYGVGVRRYNGPDDGEDRPVRLLVDKSGVYVLGRSWGRGKTGKSGFQIALVKYDTRGAVAWTLRFDGGHGDDEPADMALDRDGSLYITGQSRAEPGTGPELDILTLKLSKSGKLLWQAREGSHNLADDHPCAIGLDGGGNVIVVGEGRGALSTPDAARTGCRIIKYDPSGRLLWSRGTVEEGDRIETVIAAAVNGEGETAITGLAHNTRAFPVIRTEKRNANGLPLWTADFGYLAGEDDPSAVTFDSQGILVCGAKRPPKMEPSLFTLSYDATGKPVWQHFVGVPEARSRATAIGNFGDLPVVVGQVSDGRTAQMITITYRL